MADHANSFFWLTILAFLTILVVFGMKYFSVGRRERARAASGDAYRDLAEKTVSAQAKITASLSSVQSDLADMKQRLAAVEKVLRQVE